MSGAHDDLIGIWRCYAICLALGIYCVRNLYLALVKGVVWVDEPIEEEVTRQSRPLQWWSQVILTCILLAFAIGVALAFALSPHPISN